MSTAALLATALLAHATAGSPATTAQVVPTRFEAGHVFAVPETATGQPLKLLVDTGGGGGSGRAADNGDDLLGTGHATRLIEVPRVAIAG